MFIFNNNYKRQLSNADLIRLARLKRACDTVYEYYNWLSANSAVIDNSKEHTIQIEVLRQDVKTALFLGELQEPLVNFFIACVLFAIYNSHQEGAPQGTPCPIDRSKLEVMYDHAAVKELLINANHALLSYASGVFLLINNSPTELSSIELIKNGSLVMADIELVDTINLSQSLLDSGKDFEELTEDEIGAIFMADLIAFNKSFGERRC